MFQLNDAWDEVRKVIGQCSDDKVLKWSSDAVQLVMNKLDGEGYKGFLDVCSAGCSCNVGPGNIGSVCNNPSGCGRRCLTMPREVSMIIGVNIGGQPVLGYGQLFNFHLNGPGDCRTVCEWKWTDGGSFHSTYRDIIIPAKLIAYTQLPDDNDSQFIVYGFDDKGNLLRRFENGTWVNGILIPTIFGVALPDADAPKIARITNIFKARTAGSVRLSTIDDSGSTGILLGVYEPDEQTPQYRRIVLNRSCNWARVAYRKTNPTFFSRFDHVPMLSRLAFILAVQAVKKYNETLTAEGNAFEANASRIELEAQQQLEPPTYMPMQVIDMSNPRDKYDYDIR